MITIRIDNRVRIDMADMPDDIDLIERLKKEFEHENPAIGFKKRLGIPTWGEPKVYKTWKMHGRDITFPRGGMRKLRELLTKKGVPFRVRDLRCEGGPNPRPPKYCGLPLRWYQDDGRDAAMTYQNCILRAPTGSGKTTMAFALVSAVKVNTLVIVPTKALLLQWRARAQKELGIKSHDLGVIEGKKRQLRPLTIVMQRTLAARGIDSEMKDYFGAVICDEVQLFAAKTFFEAVDPFPAKYRIGISADERRRDRKEFLTHDLFGDVKHEVLRKTLEEEGHVMDVEVRIVPTEFRADWYGLADKDDEDDDRKVDFKRLLDEITVDDERNQLITDIALEEARAGEQVILLSHRREHCITLDRAFVAEQVVSGYLIGGEDYAVEYSSTKAGIESGKTRVGIGTYLALGYGIDLPAVGAGFMCTPMTGKQNANQVRGRVCRPAKGKERSVLYYFWDQHIYGIRLVKNFKAWFTNVVVRAPDGKWIPARHYINQRKKRRR